MATNPGQQATDRLISGATFFFKFVFPTLFVGFGLGWSISLGFFSIGKGSPSVLLAVFGLLIVVSGLNTFFRYHLPLKRVWVGDAGLRVSNFRTRIDIPFAGVESATQMTRINLRYVIIELNEETIFGHRFTFVPRNPKPPWPVSSGEDAVVVDLRNRVAIARKLVARKPIAGSGRSIMADDDLDGPF